MNKAIIFDLDGTLVDTVPDVTLALNHTLHSYNLLPISQCSVLNFMGHGAKFMLEQSFRHQNKIIHIDEMNSILQTYLNFYQANPVVKTALYPNVMETLMHLKKNHFKLGICTNKPSLIARIVLKKLELDSFFSAILCGDEITRPKPDKQHIHDVLMFLNADASYSVMVGDSHIDELCALNSGIQFVGVTYGYGSSAFKPAISINAINELSPILNQRGLL